MERKPSENSKSSANSHGGSDSSLGFSHLLHGPFYRRPAGSGTESHSICDFALLSGLGPIVSYRYWFAALLSRVRMDVCLALVKPEWQKPDLVRFGYRRRVSC